MLVGTNLDSIKDYSPSFAFADCMRMARAWGTANAPHDQKAVLGPDGMPIGDFGTVVMTSVNSPGGIYKLTFSGKADISCPGSNAKIQNIVYDGIQTKADIVLAQGSQLFLAFKNTVGVKKISLIRPNCTPDMLFNPVFLADVKNYRVIRFMDWLQTNNSPIKTWADRKRPDEILQSGPRGAALEYCIGLCNLAGCDMWLNIPHMADDDYIVQAATLVKAKLDPLLNVYVEYSNEVWNSIFSQTKWNEIQAQTDVAAGQSDLSLEGTDPNIYYWARRRIAKKVARIGAIFRSLISSNRIRPILANQIADPSIGRAQLQYLAKYFSPVNETIYGIAGAPYFATQADDITGATLQTVLTGLASSVKSNTAAWIADSTWDGKNPDPNKSRLANMAKYHGIKFVFYECGQHMLGNSSPAQALDLQVQTTVDMGKCYADYFDGMNGKIDLACHFVNIAGPWGVHGYWGLTDDWAKTTPKQQAVLAACKKYNGASMDELKKQIADLQSQLTLVMQQLAILQNKIAQIKQIAS
jgi:hypothetical protein